MKKKVLIAFCLLGLLLFLFFRFFDGDLPKNYGAVDYQLFLSGNEKSAMIVGFGGSEGGMIYAGQETQHLRDSILALGYHFLAVAYFGTPQTPKRLDRISLDAIHDTIKSISQHPLIDTHRIAVFGGSRGGELVLNLASRYDDIAAVIAIVPSNVSLPSKFGWGETSSWTFEQ
jgi:acetyl esterase/lipase